MWKATAGCNAPLAGTAPPDTQSTQLQGRGREEAWHDNQLQLKLVITMVIQNDMSDTKNVAPKTMTNLHPRGEEFAFGYSHFGNVEHG